MGKPYPMELRSRVIGFVEESHSNRDASRHFRVSPRLVNNMIMLKAETGSLAARQQGHGVGLGKLSRHTGFVRQRINENGDLTLDELCVELA